MAGIAINTVIKIVIGVFILVVVIFSSALAFNNYIKPYFESIWPSPPGLDLTNPFFSDLMRPENLVAVTLYRERGVARIGIGWGDYYEIIEVNVPDTRSLNKDCWLGGWLETGFNDIKCKGLGDVADIKNHQVFIDPKYLDETKYPFLWRLHESYFIKDVGKFYKKVSK